MTQIINPSQAVICLHDIARYVEYHFKNDTLAKDIRKSADNLNKLAKAS